MQESGDASHTGEFPVYSRLDLEIVSGSGMKVTDDRGQDYIDFYGGHAAALLGHSPPFLVAALHKQASALLFQTNLVDVGIRQRAIAAILALTPVGIERAFLVNSGSEAVENALRLAFTATKRKKVVALTSSFHGRTAGAAAVTHGAMPNWYGFPRTPFDVEFVAPGDEDALSDAVGGETAALIVEPIQGVAGARDLADSFLQHARAVTREQGACLIVDEVQSGMGRSGSYFAIEAADVEPDILVSAKGLAGGFPAGAVMTTARLADQLSPGAMGSTFGGGPLAAAMIVAVCDALHDGTILANVRDVSRLIRTTCCHGCVESIQGRGLLLGLRTKPPAVDVLDHLRSRHILAGSAADPHVVRLMPPLVATFADVELLSQALLEMPS